MDFPPYSPPISDRCDDTRIEAVTTCVGFDDYLDVALSYNHSHLDTLIVVTSHDDKLTHAVCRKHGCTCVQTDLFKKDGRNFNKGAAINAGFSYFRYFGWRLHLDVDILLPDNFNRLLFNHHALDKSSIYGADRVDVVGLDALAELHKPQHKYSCLVQSGSPIQSGARYVDPLYGYVPIGYFQLWHASAQKSYPYSLGTAAHDDVMFAALWPQTRRQLLPGVICYHLCSKEPVWGEQWEGKRKQPRLK